LNSTDFLDANAAISDSNGQLQFYFNGIDIFDKTYAVMQNGDLINEYSSFGFVNVLVLGLVGKYIKKYFD
jgi:hypothetical protein